MLDFTFYVVLCFLYTVVILCQSYCCDDVYMNVNEKAPLLT